MFICLPCQLKQHPEHQEENREEWERAPKVYEQCAICLSTTRCAEL
jgi:hypothetical protein